MKSLIDAADSCQAGADLGFAYAASSFSNALLKESTNWHWLEQNHPWRQQLAVDCDLIAVVPTIESNDQSDCLLIPVTAASESSVYRCYHSWSKLENGVISPVSLEQAAAILIKAHAQEGGAESNRVLPQRVGDSLDQVNELLASRELAPVFAPRTNFINSEQALLGGHPSHPCPRAKGGFSDEDSKAYSPEHQGQFALHWFGVDPQVITGASRGADLSRRLWQLVDSDDSLKAITRNDLDGLLPWPMHPWQAQKILQEPHVQSLIQQGKFKDLGVHGEAWTATSSLRCIYRSNAPYMLKYSLSVQLTNSIRHLLPHEVERGLQVVDVWDSPLGQQFSERYPSFSVIREPAWLALKDQDGEPMINTISVLRDNVFTDGSDQQVHMLGSLCQLPPQGQSSQLANIIRAKAEIDDCSEQEAACHWYSQFLSIALKPMLMAQADEGLLFGAHQQNTLLRLDKFTPVHFYYRDCQGTGFSALGVSRHHEVLGQFADDRNQLEEIMANRLFTYYLIVNTLFAVIASIAQDGLLKESVLLDMTRDFLQSLLDRNPRDTSCLEFLLNSDDLYVKGNLLCSLRNINENTMTNPLDLYLPLHNPLHDSNTKQHSPQPTETTETS